MNIIKLLSATCLVLFVGCGKKGEDIAVLKIKGSESLHETFSALKEDFEILQDTIRIELEGGGSRTGLMAIKNHQVDIGLSSYSFDLDSIFGDNHGVVERIIAYDGIVLINNMENPIKELSDSQITKIYNGEISNWSEVGGEPGRILPIIRNENSGTQKFFSEHFGLDVFSHEVVIAAENEEIIEKVLEDPFGIGFIGFSYISLNVQDMHLSSISRDDTFYVAPTFRTIRQGDYPLKRELKIYYQEVQNAKTISFLKYLASDRAQSIIENKGLISNGSGNKLSSL